MKGAPRSERFDDVYFSAENGLAETKHVFIAGNNLPEGWAGRERFVIAETGFGTGLNILAAWALFRKTAEAGQKLDFISFEQFPLRAEEIRAVLMPFAAEFTAELEMLLAVYPMRAPGFHRLVLDERTTLTLILDDVNAAIPEVEAAVDCWFLDGFKPASNPEMWTETVFQNMARLSRVGASFATFTSAGFVKRGLQAAGFDVRKVQGYGTKREMLTGNKS